MKSSYLLLIFLLCFSQCIWAQSTETFETESSSSTRFTDNGQAFNITSQAGGTFDVITYSGGGWNGTSRDNRFIDNTNSSRANIPVQFTISSEGSVPFSLKSIYLFLSTNALNLNVAGSVTITGKLGGATKFTLSQSTGFTSSMSVNNGFTFFNLATLGSQDYSNEKIDQYVITTTGNIAYVCLDAMTWCATVSVSQASQTNVSCNGENNGSATVTASSSNSFSYDWTPGNPDGDGTPTVTGLTPGNWTCTVTNECGNSSATTFTITEPSVLTATQSQENVRCRDDYNGSATVNVSGGTGPYRYLWSPAGGSEATASNLPAGDYTVTVADANDCIIQRNFTITTPPYFSITTSQTNISCGGLSDGSATVNVSGATGPYTYLWSPSGGNAATATNLARGYYTVTITDANGCTVQPSFSISGPPVLTTMQWQTTSSCTVNNGYATVSVTSGIGPYTYSWAPYGGNAPTATNLGVGNYTVTITDVNGCSIQRNVPILPNFVATPTAASPQNFSNISKVSDLAATGQSIKWYTTATGGTALAGTTRLEAGTYYGSQTIDGCESGGRVPVTVNITTIYNILYVKAGATGDGTTWENANGDLQSMINLAQHGMQVWVATGTYLPSAGSSFSLKQDVSVYGGFAATGNPTIDDRNYAINPTILQGNNSRVISNTNINNTAFLDGFVIQGGTLSGGDNGAGISNTNSSPVISNCIIRNNTTQNWGGGIYNSGADARSNMINCLIYGNSAGGGGGAFDYDNAMPVYINCTIANNHSAQNGGGVHTHQNATATLKNSIIWGNTCGAGGKQLYSSGGGNMLTYYCNVANGSNDISGSYTGTTSIASNPVFNNTATGDYTLRVNSAAINAGNDSYYPYSITLIDAAGNTRFYNNGTIDMGAYEYQGSQDCYLTTTWNGSNWSNGTPVSVIYNAVIEGNYTSTGNITACSLTVNSGDVIVGSGHNFIIKGAVNVTAGSLTFEQNSNLVQTGNSTNSGIITYKRDSSLLYGLDHTIWSSPVTGSQTLKDFSPQTLDSRFYVYNTPLNAYSNYLSASGVFGGNPDAETFVAGKGYLIRMPDGLDENTQSVFNGAFIGTPNNGDISIALGTGGNRFNAVGNPYPSSLNIWNFIDANQGQLDNGTLYFWRKTNNAATTYATITKLAYNANGAQGGEAGGAFSGASSEWVINGGQGFFVKAAETATALAFNNTMRRASNNGQFFRTDGTRNDDVAGISRFWLNLTGEGSAFAQTTIGYTPLTTTALDYGWDGRLLSDGEVASYSFAGTTKLAIQARGSFEVADVVALGFKPTNAGNYTYSLNTYDGLFAAGQDIFLKDNLLGITHNLKQAPYSFATEAGTFDSRFEVVYVTNVLDSKDNELVNSNVVLYQKDKVIHIKCANVLMNDIRIYDIRGALVYERSGISASSVAINDLAAEQQVLIVQITTKEGTSVTKKIIY